MTTALAIRLLGPARLLSPSPSAFPEKGFHLLALLCGAHGHRRSRRELATTLWDRETEASSLTNLRQLLARMRKVLPKDLLVASGQDVALGPLKTAIDWCAFEELTAQPGGDIAGALGLIGGDLLENAGEATETFNHWLMIERLSLRSRIFRWAEQALVGLTRFGKAAAGELAEIEKCLLSLDPDREQSYRALIDAYARAGNHAEAGRCVKALKARLGADRVSAETAAVVRHAFATRATERLMPQGAAAPATPLPRIALLAPAWPSGAVNNRLAKVFFEDIANELSRHRAFAILAPHSSFQIDHDSGVPADNSILRADYTISGFAKPSATGATLALRMANCRTHEIFWAGQFSIGPQDLLRSFDALVQRIATTLAANLEADLRARRRANGDPRSYLDYLEGMHALGHTDLASLRRARRSFRQAMQADDSLAAVPARLAQTEYLEWIQMGGVDPQLLQAASRHARQAIDTDVNDPIGHWMDGTVALYQREFDHSAAKFAEAETLAPNSADFLIQYADALAHLGDLDRSWERFERALDLNPAPPDHYWWAGASIAFRQRRYESTIELCGRLASDEAVLGMLCASYAYLGDRITARRYGGRLQEIFPNGAALERSKVVPDRDDSFREHRTEGLRLAGVT